MNLPHEGESPKRDASDNGESRLPRKLGDLQKTITMAQIAKAAGVSQGAISSLLNDRDYGIRVSEKTRERVFKVCREMGYLPNDLRAVVRMYPELGEFGLLISNKIPGGLTDPFTARVVAATMSAVPEPSRNLNLACYDESLDYLAHPERLPHPVSSGVVSKLICLGSTNSSLLQAIIRRGSAVIALGHDAQIPGVVAIVPDYTQACHLAVEHLFQLGHRNIAIISGSFGSTDPVIIELNRGVRLAFEQFGIPLEAHDILYGDLTHAAGVAAYDRLAERAPEVTAVFCLNDTVAAGFVAQAQARGRKVPQDLSVIGCADDSTALLVQPALTTIHLPAEEMAAMAVKETEYLVREPIPTEPRKTVLPVHLVSRGSTAQKRP